MLKLLAFLWNGCWHEWSPVGKGDYTRTNDSGERNEGHYTIHRCAKCGRDKVRKYL